MTKRVAIIDDAAYMRALIREVLTGVGLTVVGEAATGATGIELYRQHQPDLVILDLVLSDMNGLEVLKEIKTCDPQAKIIICSAMGQSSTVMSTVKAGASEFVVKPFDNRHLIDAVCRVLNLNFIETSE